MDPGELWRCEACGAPNAGYRRRCQDCGAKRPADPQPAPEEPVGPVDVGEIPMPLVARRPTRRLGRWPTAVLTTVVIALAIYGAVAYFTAGDGPDPDRDREAVLGAIAFLDGAAPLDGAVLECPPAPTVPETGLPARATVAATQRIGAAVLVVTVFENPVAARAFADEHAGCDAVVETEGRAVVAVQGPDAEQVVADVFENLELEG